MPMEVEKRKVRDHSRIYILVLILVMLAVALGVRFVLLPSRQKVSVEVEKAEQPFVLREADISEIEKVTITPLSGNPYTLEVSGGTLVLSENADFPIDVTGMPSISAGISIISSLPL